MTSNNLRAICVIAIENNLQWRNGFFYDDKGTKYVPTRMGIVPNINYNYRIQYDSVKNAAERVGILKEQVETLRNDLVGKKSKRAILNQIDRLSPDEALEWIKTYLS